MGLRIKYLLPLNAAILAIWMGYSFWNLKVLEKEFMCAEVNAIKHLALGLRFSVEHIVHQNKTLKTEIPFIEEMFLNFEKLDIMILDNNSVVKVSTFKDRVGKTWYEPDIEHVLSGKEEVRWKSDDHEHDGKKAIDVTIAVKNTTGDILYVIHIAKHLDNLQLTLEKQQKHHVLFVIGILLTVAIFINLLTHQFVLRPIDRLHKLIEKSGWLKKYLRGTSSNELEHLRLVLVEMIAQIDRDTDKLQQSILEKQNLLSEVQQHKENIEKDYEKVRHKLAITQKNLIISEKLNALSQLSAALAHELRNPLHIIRGAAETIARRFVDTKEFIVDITEEVDRIGKLIEKLLNYTSPLVARFEQTSPLQLLKKVKHRSEQAATGSKDLNKKQTIRISSEVPSIMADSFLLEQALTNLLDNALEASLKNSVIELQANDDNKGGVIFAVLDYGNGISEDVIKHVFEPFFTRKPNGTGLGLSIVEKIAQLHGGSIKFKNRKLKGTIALLHIPYYPSSSNSIRSINGDI